MTQNPLLHHIYKNRALLVLLVFPVALVIFNDEWLYTRAREADPWRFIGYAYHYLHDPWFENDDYKISRLPWIIIECVFRTSFSPVVAPYLLKLSLLSVSTIGFYLTTRTLFGDTSAFCTTALMQTFSQILVNRSLDYNTNGSGPLFIWTIFLIVHSHLHALHAQSRYLALLLCGMFYALTVHMTFNFIFFLPIVLLSLYLKYFRNNTVALLRDASVIVFGFLLATVLLGAFNKYIGRDFWFVWPQIQLILDLQKNPAYMSEFYQSGLKRVTMYIHVKHLAIILGCLILSIAVIVRAMNDTFRTHERRSEAHERLFFLSIVFTMTFVSWAAIEYLNNAALLWDFMAYPLFIASFYCIAAYIGLYCSSQLSWSVLCITPAAAVLTLLFGNEIYDVSSTLLTSWNVLLPLCLYLLSFVVIRHLTAPNVALVLFTILFSITNILQMSLVSYFPDAELTYLKQIGFTSRDCHQKKDAYLSVIDLRLWLMRYDIRNEYVWWDPSEGVTIANCPNSVFLLDKVGYSTTRSVLKGLYETEPTVTIDSIPESYLGKEISSNVNSLVALITNDEAHVERLISRLNRDRSWSIVSRTHIAHGDIVFNAYLIGRT